MARDTRGRMPPQTSRLKRVSLNPGHWRRGRWSLLVEAVVLGAISTTGLIALLTSSGPGSRVRVWVFIATPALDWILLVLAVGALVSYAVRRVALAYTTAVAVGALIMMVVCGTAAAHRDPGPLGLTAAAVVFYALLFAVNLGLVIWLLPDHIGGPAWVQRRDARRRQHTAPKPPSD